MKKPYNPGDEIYWIVDKHLITEHLSCATVIDVVDHGYLIEFSGRRWVVPFSEVVDNPENWVAPDFDMYDF